MLAHMVWNCALNTGSRRMSALCFIANSSSFDLKVISWSFICCSAARRTSSPADLNCSCVWVVGVEEVWVWVWLGVRRERADSWLEVGLRVQRVPSLEHRAAGLQFQGGASLFD